MNQADYPMTVTPARSPSTGRTAGAFAFDVSVYRSLRYQSKK